MTTPLPAETLEVQALDGITVVRFLRRTILDPLLIEAVGDRLTEVVLGPLAPRILIDFSRVESVTSAMLGRFISLYQSIHAAGGTLAFCGVGPFLQQIFNLCHLPAGIPIYSDERSALESLRSG